jgi:hypothetical protein
MSFGNEGLIRKNTSELFMALSLTSHSLLLTSHPSIHKGIFSGMIYVIYAGGKDTYDFIY